MVISASVKAVENFVLQTIEFFSFFDIFAGFKVEIFDYEFQLHDLILFISRQLLG